MELRVNIGNLHCAVNRNATRVFDNLWDVEVKIFSQWGEDGILDFLSQKLDIYKPRVLEIGAGSFYECNSRFLAHSRNASVYAVDSRFDLEKGIKETNLRWRNTLCYEQVIVDKLNARAIQNRASNAIGTLDILSIDIDGNDYWIAEQMNLEEFRIIVVEYNPLFGDREVSVEYSEKSRFERHPTGLLFGASLRAWIVKLRKYKFVFLGTNRVGNNAFFIKHEFIDKVPLKLPDIRDLTRFLDWRCRESRDETGQLNYKNYTESLEQIKELFVINIKNQTKAKLKDCF